MNLAASRILLTGATGGIGRALAFELAGRGARLSLLARDERALAALVQSLRAKGAEAMPLVFDLSRREGHAAIVSEALAQWGGLDALINNAGVSSFSAYSSEDADAIARLVDINVRAPMLLTRAVLPHFAERRAGLIANIGSILGSIALPHFTAYSASKFAMRGFSQALRRELKGTGVKVAYIAPRTTATAMNGPPARAYMQRTGAAVDAPETVARVIADALERERAETSIGRPERMFMLLNALLPRLVDRALVRQKRIAEHLLRAFDA